MSNPNEANVAAEFQTKVEPGHKITLPDDLAKQFPAGTSVRVLVLQPVQTNEYEFGTNEDWADVGALLLAEASKDDEWDNDQLLKG